MEAKHNQFSHILSLTHCLGLATMTEGHWMSFPDFSMQPSLCLSLMPALSVGPRPQKLSVSQMGLFSISWLSMVGEVVASELAGET